MKDQGERKLVPILFVAYQFPPRGGPGVHRSLNFVKNLCRFGFDPIVFTVRKEDYVMAGEIIDESLSREIPGGTRIIRTASSIPFKFIRLTSLLRIFRFFWFFFYPLFWERMARWPNKVYTQAEREVESSAIPIVYTTSGPFSSLLLGLRLKTRLGIRWVADLRDPFTDAYAWNFPSRIHWLIARGIERKVLNRADIIIVNTPEVKRLFLRRGIGTPDTVQVITNGY